MSDTKEVREATAFCLWPEADMRPEPPEVGLKANKPHRQPIRSPRRPQLGCDPVTLATCFQRAAIYCASRRKGLVREAQHACPIMVANEQISGLCPHLPQSSLAHPGRTLDYRALSAFCGCGWMGVGGREWESNPLRAVWRPSLALKASRPTGSASPPISIISKNARYVITPHRAPTTGHSAAPSAARCGGDRRGGS